MENTLKTEISEEVKTDLEKKLVEELKPNLDGWLFIPEDRVLKIAREYADYDYLDFSNENRSDIGESGLEAYDLYEKYTAFHNLLNKGIDYQTAKGMILITANQIEIVDEWLFNSEMDHLDSMIERYNLSQLESDDGDYYYAVPKKHEDIF